MDSTLASLITRLERVTVTLEGLASHGAPGKGTATTTTTTTATSTSNQPATMAALSPAVAQFAALMAPESTTFFTLSARIGGLVGEQATRVWEALTAEGELIALASRSKRPADLAPILAPLQAALLAAQAVRENNRKSEYANHLSVVAEGCSALGWVAVEPAPAAYVGDMKESAQFYANRVIKEFREKDKIQVDWAQAFIAFLASLQVYVKQHHTTGLTWNAAMPVPSVVKPSPAATATKPTGLLAELSGNVTAGLRKVDASEMTHKNADLRASGVVKATASRPPAPVPVKAPPKLALEGNKWCVENQINVPDVVVEGVELRQTVYIYNCTGSTITIKGKVNAITIDGSKKCGLLVDSVVSTIDVVNCKSGQLQITGRVPTISVDKTDGLQIFLSQQSLDVELFTAKCSEINVSLPIVKEAESESELDVTSSSEEESNVDDDDDDDSDDSADKKAKAKAKQAKKQAAKQSAKKKSAAAKEEVEFVEAAVPEQFRTKVVKGKLVTSAVEHKG